MQVSSFCQDIFEMYRFTMPPPHLLPHPTVALSSHPRLVTQSRSVLGQRSQLSHGSPLTMLHATSILACSAARRDDGRSSIFRRQSTVVEISHWGGKVHGRRACNDCRCSIAVVHTIISWLPVTYSLLQTSLPLTMLCLTAELKPDLSMTHRTFYIANRRKAKEMYSNSSDVTK